MNKNDLKKVCILPTWKVEVEQKVAPNKASHKSYWEWVTPDDKRSLVPPKNKIGKWQLFVDVVSPGKAVLSFEATEDEASWEKLETAIKNSGYNTKTNQEEFSIDLQNGILRFSVARVLTDDGFMPQMKLTYTDNDDLYCSSFDMNLERPENLKQIGEMFLSLAEKFSKGA